MGQGAGAIHEVKPAAEIITEMMEVASEILSRNAGLVSSGSEEQKRAAILLASPLLQHAFNENQKN